MLANWKPVSCSTMAPLAMRGLAVGTPWEIEEPEGVRRVH